MTKNEEFEKWDEENDKLNLPVPMRILAAWNARQPEIDALRAVISTQQDELFKFRAEVERLKDAADRAEGFLFAVSLMPQLGPKVQDVALRHHEALRAAMKESK